MYNSELSCLYGSLVRSFAHNVDAEYKPVRNSQIKTLNKSEQWSQHNDTERNVKELLCFKIIMSQMYNIYSVKNADCAIFYEEAGFKLRRK